MCVCVYIPLSTHLNIGIMGSLTRIASFRNARLTAVWCTSSTLARSSLNISAHCSTFQLSPST